MPNEAAFFIGVLAGMLAIWILQLWSRGREQKRVAGADAAELTAVNRRLTGELEDMQARLHVLERVVTDPAHRTAAEIEQLR